MHELQIFASPEFGNIWVLEENRIGNTRLYSTIDISRKLASDTVANT